MDAVPRVSRLGAVAGIQPGQDVSGFFPHSWLCGPDFPVDGRGAVSGCLLLGHVCSACAGRQKPRAEVLPLTERDVTVPKPPVQGEQGKHSNGLIAF